MNPRNIIPTKNGFKFTLPVEKTDRKAWAQELNQKTTEFEFYHTPGHTKGSQCILVNHNRLFSGDTLFITGCGRLDFPDSCKHSMFNSLQVTLAGLGDNVMVKMFLCRCFQAIITGEVLPRSRTNALWVC